MKSKNFQTNQIKENLISTLRALVANEALQVEFEEERKNNFFAWDQGLIGEGGIVNLPQINTASSYPNAAGRAESRPSLSFSPLHQQWEQELQDGLDAAKPAVGRFRAVSDMAACYLLFHDKNLHQEKKFDQDEQKFFNEFEKIRVLAEVKNSYHGVVKNIVAKVEDDIFSGSNSLSLLLLKEIFEEEILPRTVEAVLDLEKKLSKKILQEIKNLAKKTASQNDFAAGVERVLELLKNEQDAQEQEDSEEKSQSKKEKPKKGLSSFGQETIDAKDEENLAQNEQEAGEEKIPDQQKISDLKESDQKGEVTVRLDKSGQDEDKIEFKNAYKIFTSKFDEVIFPQKLVSKNELELLRDQLDLRLAKLKTISKKMSLKLKRKLLSKRNSFLEYDSSRGILDRKKLTRLVIDPLMEDVWVNQKNHEYQDTCLTILLDNSGSMRGSPIVMSALACEIIAEILEKFSVKTEIIGFTTADWKGGRVRKLWESSGRPSNPGRLNELRHVIYKHFHQSFKKSRVNLGLMLKEGVLKENIDGEALLFARSRLMQQSEKRKILLVISDGTPVDDSTASANDGDILSDHLSHVINKIERCSPRQSKIEIVGIGIGHTTEEFYRNSIAIKSLEELGDVMIKKITELL